MYIQFYQVSVFVIIDALKGNQKSNISLSAVIVNTFSTLIYMFQIAYKFFKGCISPEASRASYVICPNLQKKCS